MKIIYAGKYSGDPESLPNLPHRKNAVCFKEPDSMKKLAVILNIVAGILVIVFVCLFVIRAGIFNAFDTGGVIGCIAPVIVLIPHEFLHAICFKEDAHIYTNLKQGMLFVFGAEDMSKSRFVFMSLLPNVVFGLIPYIVGMIFPSMSFFGIFGAICLGSGSGDYMNVINALTQVPKKAKIYMYGFHTYWYLPEEN